MPDSGAASHGIHELPAKPVWFDTLVQRATRFDGQPPFSDGSLVDLATGSRTILAIGDVAAALLAESEAELVVDPDARQHGHGGELLDALLERIPSGLRVWAHGDHPAARALAASRGLVPVRELLQLRVKVAPAPGHGGSSRSPQNAQRTRVSVRPRTAYSPKAPALPAPRAPSTPTPGSRSTPAPSRATPSRAA
jgi:GNAT superfamily N-acetyltransferase